MGYRDEVDQLVPHNDVYSELRKRCRECGESAKIGDDIDHAPDCSGSPNICDVVTLLLRSLAHRGTDRRHEKGGAMDEFSLDKTENPHPAMLKRALKLRARTRVTHSPSDGHIWHGYLLAMCDATGETAEAIEAWMDRNDVSDRSVKS